MHKHTFSRLVLVASLLTSPLFLSLPAHAAITNQQWTAVSNTNAPAGRRSHVAVWTGSEMLIWGGQTLNGFNQSCSDNDGARYNPTTDTWTAMSSTNAPTRRREARAVWTGTEMIVWGGEECNGNATWNTGARYNPATDTWTPMTTTNAPTGRYVHTAVWTGTEMIVWGGDAVSPGVISLNDGGRYNPATDTWTAISTTGAPSPKSHPTSVWTGSKMIVWGGSDDCCGVGSDLPGGGIYDPTTDSWSSMAAGNSAAGYKFHSSAWTGSEMIVWGGHDSTNVFTNVGQRYNPATNTWTNMSTTNAPNGRGYLDGIWAGSAFFVWGGYDGSVPFLNTGGLYDPVTDTWTTITSTNAPSNRDVATLVWTDNSVILWGGFNFDGSNSYFRGDGAEFTFDNGSTPTGPQVSDFVILGQEGVWIKQGTVVNSGDVGANAVSSGPYLDSSVEVSIGDNVSVSNSGSAVYGDSVRLKAGSQVNDLFYNDKAGSGTATGTQTTPLSLPFISSFPTVPTFSAGTTDVNVAANATQNLSAGSYEDLTVLHDATLTFTGGTYNFASWDIRDDVKLYFNAASEVRISGKLSTNSHVQVVPAPSSGLDATDIKIFVTGVNGSNGNVGSTPKAAQFGMANTVTANVYANNGTLFLREDATATGAFLGKWVVMGETSNVTLDSGF